MEPTRPKLPSEAVELYNLFIHGVISRRAFMDGVQKFAAGGLAALKALGDPKDVLQETKERMFAV